MAWDLLLWLCSFFTVAAILGILVYQLMCLSDLEFDYINPFDSTSRINKFVLPEFALHGCLCCLYLVTGHWLMCLINIPLLYYHARLYFKEQHLVDVTEIFNLLDREKKYRLAKLAFYLLLFFTVIYRMVVSAVFLILEHDDAAETAATFTGLHSDMSSLDWNNKGIRPEASPVDLKVLKAILRRTEALMVLIPHYATGGKLIAVGNGENVLSSSWISISH